MHAKAVSSKFISNFSVVPWGGAAFNATQFSRQEQLNKHSLYIMMKGFRLSIARHFQSCDFVLLSIHVVFYCSLRLAPRCLASTLVIIKRTFKIYGIWPQASTYISTLLQYSPTSVGLTQARPNDIAHYLGNIYMSSTLVLPR